MNHNRNHPLTLVVLPEKLAVCRLDADSQIPDWAIKSAFFSITKTLDELSIVLIDNDVPAEIKAEKYWRSLKVQGPLDFALTGVLVSLIAPLAEARISIFALSTFDTDYILVKEERLEESIKILSQFCTVIC